MEMMNIQPVECVSSAVQLEMCVHCTVCALLCVCWLLTIQIAPSFKVQWLTDRWMIDSRRTGICRVRVWNFLVCVWLCLCCVKWNGQQAFWVAQGTSPSDWSDKGRGGVERRTRIDPMMNDQGEAADVMKWARRVCLSFLFPLIHLALWYVCCISALLHHRQPIIVTESQNDVELNKPWKLFFFLVQCIWLSLHSSATRGHTYT